MANKYEIIVGNIGTVYAGEDRDQAFYLYNWYCEESSTLAGRAGGERVSLLEDGDVLQDWAPSDDDCESDDDEPRGSHDCSDDGDALASAGFGTDEDYGDWGGGDDF